jgi:hypothetical protein
MSSEKNSKDLTFSNIIKQVVYALLTAGVILGLYLASVNTKTEDAIVGKHAYMNTNGSYMGKIKGTGFSSKSQAKVYYIEEPTGNLIEIPVKYITVKDKGFDGK